MKIFAAITAFAVAAVSGVAAYEGHRGEFRGHAHVGARPGYNAPGHIPHAAHQPAFHAPGRFQAHHAPAHNGFRGAGRHF
ncbi:hypothetical protein H4S06_002747 [Coemansia sp. BCRC 34490]|nr:hypothetical protein LPJ72_004502 [Coemansia sp. Benny D160-2]KAJ2510265.1 hypothetical protein H4217_007959 [Coemansia sp. RSA 1939]KAJ2513310.1 hypothetical protein GGI11_004452 [Coemansia sp. RSA 2049]KAJ2590600.1 hypothetical protein EV177_009041 [Coemansia sp. RSA 1804]KAJ2656087.1 hypothetical protein IWW48_005211 [Coemansia sp. RSA 1200]KAJ2683665.1 hypothetical protein GGH99_004289 [Coemansia sp. RSA 1285]KAJ2758334.1 hypothetical protein H4S06_002747 [Coemansia sp. BCRC 34490]